MAELRSAIGRDQHDQVEDLTLEAMRLLAQMESDS